MGKIYIFLFLLVKSFILQFCQYCSIAFLQSYNIVPSGVYSYCINIKVAFRSFEYIPPPTCTNAPSGILRSMGPNPANILKFPEFPHFVDFMFSLSQLDLSPAAIVS